MIYIIVPFVIWILIGILLSIKERFSLIFWMFVLTSVPCYCIGLVVLAIFGIQIPTNPCDKKYEVPLTNLREDIYLYKEEYSYVYVEKDDEQIRILDALDGPNVYIEETDENFRMEYWCSYLTKDAFPGSPHYIFYIPKNSAEIKG